MRTTPQSWFRRLVGIGLFLAGFSVVGDGRAEETELPNLEISNAWIRVSASDLTEASGYLSISNSGARAERLVGVSSPIAESVKIHPVSQSSEPKNPEEFGGSADIPTVTTGDARSELLHVKFAGLRRILVPKSTVDAELAFETAGVKAIVFTVYPALAPEVPRAPAGDR